MASRCVAVNAPGVREILTIGKICYEVRERHYDVVVVGAGIGGLLNASLGNAAELIIALAALHGGLHDVVKASLTGSIIGNILLVLGVSMIAGGVKYERQQFNQTAAGMGSSLLLLAAVKRIFSMPV